MSSVQHTPPQNLKKSFGPSRSDSAPSLNLEISESQENEMNTNKRVKRKLVDTPGNSELLSEFKKMFADAQSYQERKFDTLNEAITTLMDQNCDLKKSVEWMSAKYDNLVQDMESLLKENHKFKNHIKKLEERLDLMDKNAKSTAIEIRNITKDGNETKKMLIDSVKSVCSTIGSEPALQDLEIRDIHRTKSNAILIDFTTTSRKEATVSKFKEFNKARKMAREPNLNTQALNIPGPIKPIFISEALSFKARHLYYLIREMVKNKKIVATWTSYGKIYVRKEEGKPSQKSALKMKTTSKNFFYKQYF